MTQPETLPLACPWCELVPNTTYPTGMQVHVYHGDNGCKLSCKAFPLEWWNRRSPDKPEAEAVAIETDKPLSVSIPYEYRIIILAEKIGDGPRDIYRLALEHKSSPVESAPPLPSDKLRGLVRKWRENEVIGDRSKRTFIQCADELEALLSQEPSSGAKPVAWIIHRTKSEDFITNTQQEMEAWAKKGCAVTSLFASPVTDGGGEK